MLLNTDLHNPKVKSHMSPDDFLRNNRGTNDGEDFPEDLQRRIFNKIQRDEIKTPENGGFDCELYYARWEDLWNQVAQGYRDNSLFLDPQKEYLQPFLERFGTGLVQAFEFAFICDVTGEGQALTGFLYLLELCCISEVVTIPRQISSNVADLLLDAAAAVFHIRFTRPPPRSVAALHILFSCANRDDVGVAFLFQVESAYRVAIDHVAAEHDGDAGVSSARARKRREFE